MKRDDKVPRPPPTTARARTTKKKCCAKFIQNDFTQHKDIRQGHCTANGGECQQKGH